EIRVLFRHLCAADPCALQAGRLDEAGGMVAGRILEHRAAARQAERLARLAVVEQALHALRRGAVVLAEAETRGQEPLFAVGISVRDGSATVPVADLVVPARARPHLATPVHHVDIHDLRPRLATEGAGIHAQRSADGAGNACEEFGGTEPPAVALACDHRAGYARFRLDEAVAELTQTGQRLTGGNDDSPDATVPDQEVASEAD